MPSKSNDIRLLEAVERLSEALKNASAVERVEELIANNWEHPAWKEAEAKLRAKLRATNN